MAEENINLAPIRQATIKTSEGQYEGPRYFGVSVNNVMYAETTLDQVIGPGWVSAEGSILEQLQHLTNEINKSNIENDDEITISSTRVILENNLIVRGNLTVYGDYTTVTTQTLKVKDNLIETNSDGTSLDSTSILTGLVMNIGNGKGYGICYQPDEDVVKLGIGTMGGEGSGAEVFKFEEGQGLPIAVIKHLEFADTNFIEIGGKNVYSVSDIANVYEPIAVYRYIDDSKNEYCLVPSVTTSKKAEVNEDGKVVKTEIKIKADEAFNGFILVI